MTEQTLNFVKMKNAWRMGLSLGDVEELEAKTRKRGITGKWAKATLAIFNAKATKDIMAWPRAVGACEQLAFAAKREMRKAREKEIAE